MGFRRMSQMNKGTTNPSIKLIQAYSETADQMAKSCSLINDFSSSRKTFSFGQLKGHKSYFSHVCKLPTNVPVCDTVKPVFSGHSKIDKKKVLKTD